MTLPSLESTNQSRLLHFHGSFDGTGRSRHFRNNNSGTVWEVTIPFSEHCTDVLFRAFLIPLPDHQLLLLRRVPLTILQTLRIGKKTVKRQHYRQQ